MQFLMNYFKNNITIQMDYECLEKLMGVVEIDDALVDEKGNVTHSFHQHNEVHFLVLNVGTALALARALKEHNRGDKVLFSLSKKLEANLYNMGELRLAV